MHGSDRQARLGGRELRSDVSALRNLIAAFSGDSDIHSLHPCSRTRASFRAGTKARTGWRGARQLGVRKQHIPHWSGGFLIPIERNGLDAPVIHAIDDTGYETPPLVFSIPGAHAIRIDNVARGLDGTWAVSGRARDAEGKGGGFITWLSADRQNVKTIQLLPYNAMRIAIAPDGTTWTEGIELVPDQDWVGSDHGVIRRFDKSGNAIGSWIRRNSIPEVNAMGLEGGVFAVAQGLVGWYAGYAHEYFEIVFNRSKVSAPKTWPGIASRDNHELRVNGLAILDNGDAYISAQDQKRGTSQLYILDRAHRIWIPVTAPEMPNGKPNNSGKYILA
jgi:hypothetical protein